MQPVTVMATTPQEHEAIENKFRVGQHVRIVPGDSESMESYSMLVCGIIYQGLCDPILYHLKDHFHNGIYVHELKIFASQEDCDNHILEDLETEYRKKVDAINKKYEE